jgi:hypothetical protein
MFYREHTPFLDSLKRFLEIELAEMEKTGRLWPQEQSKMDEQIALMMGMLSHYNLWVTKDRTTRLRDENIEWLSFEREFSVPLYNPYTGNKSSKVYLAGRFDGLVKLLPEGGIWIWETKSTRSIFELENSLANDEQCGAYIYAAEQLFGVPVTGVIYNVMRKKLPTEPAVLQNGLLSKNKAIDTTAEAYLEAVRRNHPDWDNALTLQFYEDILQHLIAKGNTFFARVAIYRTPTEIQRLASNLWAVALEMTRESTIIYDAPGWLSCNFCHFRAPCLAMNAGADHEFLLEQEYRKRTDTRELLYAEEDQNGK